MSDAPAVAPRRSNCIVWALRQWWRKGGVIGLVWGRAHPYTHWFHAPDLNGPLVSYAPARKPSFKPWFRGRIVTGEPEYD